MDGTKDGLVNNMMLQSMTDEDMGEGFQTVDPSGRNGGAYGGVRDSYDAKAQKRNAENPFS